MPINPRKMGRCKDRRSDRQTDRKQAEQTKDGQRDSKTKRQQRDANKYKTVTTQLLWQPNINVSKDYTSI